MSETEALDLNIHDRLLWSDGPPHEEFREMRARCPVHRTDSIPEFGDEDGFWSVTRAADIREVSLDWRTYSSASGITTVSDSVIPVDLISAMFIGMDPPRHDRLKALFQRGFTPKRIGEHEDEIRSITREVLDRLAARDRCDLIADVAQPVVSRVIGSFMGIPPEDDESWANLMNSLVGFGDPDLNPKAPETVMQEEIPQIFERCSALIEARREHPTDDLTSVLVHAEVDGERLEEHEIVMGFFLLMAAGNDSTKATYTSAMLALLEHPEERQKLLEHPDRKMIDLSDVPRNETHNGRDWYEQLVEAGAGKGDGSLQRVGVQAASRRRPAQFLTDAQHRPVGQNLHIHVAGA